MDYWEVLTDFPRYIEFYMNLREMYRKKLKKVKEEDRPLEALRHIKSAVPCRLRVLFSKEKENGYVVDVKCYSILYRKIDQITDYLKTNAPSVFEVKACISESIELLRKIFVGALGWEEIDSPHPLKPVEENRSEILFNTKTERELTDTILRTLKDAKREVYIAGWIGSYIIPTLKKLKKNGVKIKIITKTPSEPAIGYRDKTEALNELKAFLKKDDLRLLKTCHFRLVIIDEETIFNGSMDMDSQSLAEREESAIWTNDPYLVVKGKVKFEELFKKGKSPSGWK